MKVIILCGGIGTRLKEETEFNQSQWYMWGETDHLAYYEDLFSLWF